MAMSRLPPAPEPDDDRLRQARLQSAASAPPGALADELQAWAQDRSFVMSFARGLSVLHAFRDQRRALTIAQISHRTHIPRAAVRRLLHTLAELGYVRQVDNLFALTPRTLLFAHDFLSSDTLAQLARPIVSRLSQALHMVCVLAAPDADASLVVCVSNSPLWGAAENGPPNLGSRAPLYGSASGLLFLAAMDDAGVDAYCNRVSLRPFTHRTPTLPEDLRERVRQVRAQGYAVIDRTMTLTQRTVAVPVAGAAGEPIAALVAAAEAEHHSPARLTDEVLPPLRSAARDLGGLLRTGGARSPR